MAKQESRATRLEKAVALVQDGLGEIQALAEEMGSWRDNMQGTNLESTEKYTRVEECADTLQQAADDIENAVSGLESVEFPGMYG